MAVRPAKDVKIRLYNGSALPNAAAVVGATLAKAGYAVLPPDSIPGTPVHSTRIWFVKGWGIEAAGVAAALKLPAERISELGDDAPVADDGGDDAMVLVVIADDVARAVD